jgi:hypothetical protein
MVRSLPGCCCARAATGHAATAPPSSVMNSLYHLVGAGQQRWRDREAECLGGLGIDD